MALEVSTALAVPLDLVVVRKIGVAFLPELAMGAIADGSPPVVVRNDEIVQALGIRDAEFESCATVALAELERRRKRYLGDRPTVVLAGRCAIVVDDGMATGATMRAALQATRARHPARLVLAVPVAASDTVASMTAEADDVVCLESHELFGSIGEYYGAFPQVSDEEVIAALRRSDARTAETRQPSA